MRAYVYLSELADALEWVSAAGAYENAAYVSRETGRIYWHSESGETEEEVSSDANDETLYAAVPHKHDLDLGKGLSLRFVEVYAPDAYDQVQSYFSRRGAYGRLKEFLSRRGL
jgi:hypothetical protein